MLHAILICAFMVKHAATQTVTASLGTTKSCVVAGVDDVKLLCTVSSGCCTSTRVWEKVGVATSLLNNGGSLDASKYVEDYKGGGTIGGPIEFTLIIKKVQKSDFGEKYKCQYSVYSSNELYLNDTLCDTSNLGDCGECAGQDYGWSFLGDVIGTIIILIITQIKSELKTTLIVGGLTFIISAVVNAIIALPIGYFVCHCVDGTAPWSIILGLGTSGIIGVILLIKTVNKQKQGSVELGQDQKSSGSSQGSNGSSCWPPCKVEQEPKNPKIPSSNEQPVKEKKKKKPAAEKRSRSPTTGAKHIKTANNETELIPTEKGFSGDLGKKRPLPPLTNQPSPTTRPLLVPSTRPLPQITTN